jgi:hypothetical protein
MVQKDGNMVAAHRGTTRSATLPSRTRVRPVRR